MSEVKVEIDGSAITADSDRFPGQAAIAFVLALVVLFLSPFIWLPHVDKVAGLPVTFASVFLICMVIIWPMHNGPAAQ